MTVERVAEDAIAEWVDVDRIAFGEKWEDRDRAATTAWVTPAVRYGVRDNGRWVATAAHHDAELTLPGPSTVPAGRVTYVSVLPTHHRRGIARQMLEQQLRDLREGGAAAAILLASESVLYGRYGYGPATFASQARLPTAHGAFRSAPALPGTLRLVEPAEAVDECSAVYEAVRRRRAGDVSRLRCDWDHWVADPPAEKPAPGPRFCVVHEQDGRVDGYAVYTIDEHWEAWIAGSTAHVVEVVALSTYVEKALWRYLLDLDLVATVKIGRLPVDHPLAWWLEDPRRLRTTAINDQVWVRPLDLPRLLTTRSWAGDVSATLEVADPLFEDIAGRYRLQVRDGVASVERSGGEPDVRIDVADLGSWILGGVTLRRLADAGRADLLADGPSEALDRSARTDQQPFCGTMF